MKKLLIVLVFIIAISGTWWLTQKRINSKHAKLTTTSSSFDTSTHSISDPSSIWVIVNKKRPLPNNYVPANLRTPNVTLREGVGSPEMQLREEATVAVEKLTDAAQKDGIKLMLVSGYRSFSEQQTVYRGYVKQDGQVKADTYSARPGHSEHQTGLAADLGTNDRKCELEACFGDTVAGKWLAAHAFEYGFVLRYPEGSQHIVGYEYEPWHLRYIGSELALEVHKTSKTLEEIFGLQPAPDYN